MEAFIEPNMLIWAREASGLSLHEAAKKTPSIPVEKLKTWEAGQARPSLRQLENLAKRYKRPTAIFYLKETPKIPDFPRDFRVLPDKEKKHPKPETLFAVRRAKQIQNLYSELADDLNINPYKKSIRVNLRESPVTIASSVRKHLKIKDEVQFHWSDSRKALKEWKYAIEQEGILVLEFRFPIEEGRGFSISEGEFPIIVLNRADKPNAKIFTLFHEYAHLLIDNGGICTWEKESNNPDINRVEVFANSFSGNLLVPTNLLRENIERANRLNLYDKLQNNSNLFKVSRNVILRRMLSIGTIDKNIYQEFDQKLREEFKTRQDEEKKKENRRKNWLHEYYSGNGNAFSSAVLRAYRNDLISYNDVSDYLEVKIKYIPQIESLTYRSSFT